MRLKVNFKYKAIVAIVIILMILLSMKYIKPMYEYQIQDSQIAISKSISKMTGGKPIQIILIEDVDNKRIVLFQRGSEIGESMLTKGPNNKYRLDSSGYGTNVVRYRILNTNKGQYVKFVGKNSSSISRILSFVDEERYYIDIPEGEYFISYKPLTKKTSSSFPSGSIWYDDQGKEIIRVNISKDFIL